MGTPGSWKLFVIVFICLLVSIFIGLMAIDEMTVTAAPSTYVSELKIPVAFDVVRLCEKIWDRLNTSCFAPHSLILYYQNDDHKQMKFRQRFDPYVREINISSILSDDHFHEKIKKRTFCPIDDIDPLFDTMTKRNSCAIVGNSGIVLGGKCGREIDSKDLVLRANFAHIRGYEEDVGNKTSIMMINDESLRNLHKALITVEETDANHHEMLRYLTEHLNESTIWFAKGTEVHGSAEKLQKLATFFTEKKLRARLAYSMMPVDAAVSRTFERFHSYPSSGFDILAVAKSLCENITLYGFYPYEVDPNGKRILHHYYEPKLINFTTINHNFEKEHNILKDMHKKGLLRLVYDPCENQQDDRDMYKGSHVSSCPLG